MISSTAKTSKLQCILSPIWLGRISYNDGIKIQSYYKEKVKNNVDRCYLLLQEHHPVYTVGIRKHLYSTEEEERLKSLGAEFHRVGRGGLITFHGPGQLVGYPIIKISSLNVTPDIEYKNSTVGVKRYVHLLEETIIQLCVWIDNEMRKICAIGVGFSHGISYHGFALNCDTDMKWFKEITPCGLEGKEVTTLSNELNRNVTVMDVLPNLIKKFSKIFEISSIDQFKYIIIWSIGWKKSLNCNPPFNFFKYSRFGEIEKYLKWVAYSYSSITSLKTVGITYEGRPVYVLVIDTNKNIVKKDYFIISGVHAREWIAVSSTLFFLNRLLNNMPNNGNLLHQYKLHIIPVVNPDGYEYSMMVDKYWRKNRSRRQCLKNGRISNTCCIGVDLNRNFDFNFNKNADPYECSEAFGGYSPQSEAENFHAFGNLIIYPFAFPNFFLPSSMNYLHIKGRSVANEIKRKYNQNYRCGLAREFLNYGVYGSSMDFYYGRIGAKYSYVVELGKNGFHPPIDNIEPMGNIVYDMILMFAIE